MADPRTKEELLQEIESTASENESYKECKTSLAESCHIPVGTAVIRWEGSVYIEQRKGGQYMYYRPATDSELEGMKVE